MVQCKGRRSTTLFLAREYDSKRIAQQVAKTAQVSLDTERFYGIKGDIPTNNYWQLQIFKVDPVFNSFYCYLIVAVKPDTFFLYWKKANLLRCERSLSIQIKALESLKKKNLKARVDLRKANAWIAVTQTPEWYFYMLV